eukprot:scaffold38277_cov52-Phaeocystis_antarctica.AAC.3
MHRHALVLPAAALERACRLYGPWLRATRPRYVDLSDSGHGRLWLAAREKRIGPWRDHLSGRGTFCIGRGRGGETQSVQFGPGPFNWNSDQIEGTNGHANATVAVAVAALALATVAVALALATALATALALALAVAVATAALSLRHRRQVSFRHGARRRSGLQSNP